MMIDTAESTLASEKALRKYIRDLYITIGLPVIEKTVFLVRGLPGSGKSTIARDLAWGVNTIAIAADDFPGFWVTGKYQYVPEQQKESHAWCFKAFEMSLAQGLDRIAVHNTFALKFYMKDYIAKAQEYGYRVVIIHCERSFNELGDPYESIHNVPQYIFDNMASTWEPFRPVPQKGMPIRYLADVLKNIKIPTGVGVDFDNCLCYHPSQDIFGTSPKDNALNMDVVNALQKLREQCEPDIFIISNQRGVATGAKSLEWLKAEWEYVADLLAEQNLTVKAALFALGFNTKKVLVWKNEECWMKDHGFHFHEFELSDRADKPGTGMMNEVISLQQLDLIESPSLWMVGDSHHAKNDDDYRLAVNTASQYPKEAPGTEIQFIPFELLPIAVRLI